MSVPTKPARSADSGLPLGAALPALPDYMQACSGRAYVEADAVNVLLFTSMHCVHCIDLLPHIQTMAENYPDFSFRLFSTGDEEDHRSMSEYFKWEFPVYSMDQSDMEAYFAITFMPFMMLADRAKTVVAKGVIYNADDFDRWI
ncbi:MULTISPECIES: TlpA family protein disulfide reductase [Paenibacillus]|uniref:Thioredoxin domain-containing protein n=2 Tax=Paenibacillus TaxID=44249 RepID=A0A1V4HKQ9_9BACL|nr:MULTISPECIES: hypothetical protein [Paenibacillus]MEC0231973.1 hypothetical protein [Paenibacillus alba]OPH57840.1 hypothetical protein BC351_04920 [Paenibacillus ferrarius]